MTPLSQTIDIPNLPSYIPRGFIDDIVRLNEQKLEIDATASIALMLVSTYDPQQNFCGAAYLDFIHTMAKTHIIYWKTIDSVKKFYGEIQGAQQIQGRVDIVCLTAHGEVNSILLSKTDTEENRFTEKDIRPEVLGKVNQILFDVCNAAEIGKRIARETEGISVTSAKDPVYNNYSYIIWCDDHRTYELSSYHSPPEQPRGAEQLMRICVGDKEGAPCEQNYQDVLAKQFAFFKQRADKGEICFILETADRYRTGRGVELSLTQAARYYQIAADQGNPTGKYELGLLYLKGEGVPLSTEMALKYIQTAAAEGYPPALTRLGRFHMEGTEGFEKSNAETLKYLQQAVNLGDRGAHYRLGLFYQEGLVIEKSCKKAAEHLLIAADRGEFDAWLRLGVLYRDAKPSDDLPQSYEEALKYFEMGAREGYGPCMYCLGHLYKDGAIKDKVAVIEKSNAKAVKYFEQAADRDELDAWFWLGVLYRDAEPLDDPPQSYEEAVKYFEIGAEKGVTSCMHSLGDLYSEGRVKDNKVVIEKNEELALHYYSKSCEMKNPISAYELALFHMHGKGGLQKSHERTVEYLKQSALAGCILAQVALGALYSDGIPGILPQSEDEAKKLFQLVLGERPTDRDLEWTARAAESFKKEFEESLKQ
jgi:TPR repeat protein